MPYRAIEICDADPQVIWIEVDSECEKAVRIDLDGGRRFTALAVVACFLSLNDEAGFKKAGCQTRERRCRHVHLARQLYTGHASLAAQNLEQTPFIVAEVDQAILPRDVTLD